MNELLVLGIVVAGLWAVFMWQRVPAVLLFLSVLIGQLLATEVNNDAYTLAISTGKVDNPSVIQIGLLVLPVILTIVLLRHKLARSRLAIEAIPLLFVAASLVLFAAPLIPSLQTAVDAALSNFATYRSLIFATASVSILILAWITSRGGHSAKHHG